MKAAIRREVDFNDFLRHLAIVGVIAFGVWLSIGAMGYVAGYLQFSAVPAIRFMIAILILVLPTVVVPDLRTLRYRNLSPEARSGFEL